MTEEQMQQQAVRPAGSQADIGEMLAAIPGQALAVILKPADFFQRMPKTGGFMAPLVFVAAIAVAVAVLMVILGLTGFGGVGMLTLGLFGMVVVPIVAAVGSFVGAGVLFVIWKLMGSSEEYETAYRCVAYAYAYAPAALLLSPVPYVGSLVQALWPMALLALASIHVHGIDEKVSWAVFGVLGALLALSTLSGEYAMRHLGSSVENWSRQAGQEEITPEEAGKAVGEFLKGLEQMQQGGRQ